MRVAGITIPDNKRLEIGLTAVYGVGRPKAIVLLAKAKIDPGKKPKDLSQDEEGVLRKLIESSDFKIEGELRREAAGNIKRLKDIGTYRGDRHSRGLPARGQRTKTNARTKKGAKKTMGSGRIKVAKK